MPGAVGAGNDRAGEGSGVSAFRMGLRMVPWAVLAWVSGGISLAFALVAAIPMIVASAFAWVCEWARRKGGSA